MEALILHTVLPLVGRFHSWSRPALDWRGQLIGLGLHYYSCWACSLIVIADLLYYYWPFHAVITQPAEVTHSRAYGFRTFRPFDS